MSLFTNKSCKPFKKLLFLLASLLLATPSLAGVILVDSGLGAHQIDYFEPTGQSFTAEDQNIKFAFSLFDVNQSFDPGNSALTVRLLNGDGTGGLQLGSVSQVITPGTNNVFVDFDFSFLNLVVGQQYTALIEAPTARWAIEGGAVDLYAGGIGYKSGIAANGDLDFRVTPVAQVSEPSFFTIFGLGLAVLGLSRRRRPGF